MADPLWADRVLSVFEQPRERFSVSCVGCCMGFGSAAGLIAHQSFCSLLSPDLRSVARGQRHQTRSLRRFDQRAATTSIKRLPKKEQEAERAREAEAERLIPVGHLTRPRTRGECDAVERPCPFVSCRYHLYLDVGSDGSIKLNFPNLEPDELVETCALDVADAEGESLEVVGELMNVTRERIRQLESKALDRLRRRRFSTDLVELDGFDALDDHDNRTE